MFNLANTSMQTFKIEKTETQCVVTWQFYTHAVFVLLPFLACLTFPCVVVIYHVFTKQVPVQQFWNGLTILLFFGTFWFVFFVFVANIFFGKTRLVLDKTGLETLWTCLFFKRKKRIALTELRRFEKVIRKGKNGNRWYLLRVIGNKKFHFMTPSKSNEYELDELCVRLNVCLKALQACRQIPDDTTEAEEMETLFPKPPPIVFEFDSPPQYLDPPTKTRWQYQTDFDGFGFQKWDNILELFRITTWMFALGEAKFRTGRLGWVRNAAHDLTDWHSLVVRVPETEYENYYTKHVDRKPDEILTYYDGESVWQLAFLNAASERIMAIEKLSKLEALWMADVLLREQRAVR